MKSDHRNNKENDLPVSLAQPAVRALHNAGITQLEQVAKISESELKQLHGIGPKAVELLRNTLASKGLNFSDEK